MRAHMHWDEELTRRVVGWAVSHDMLQRTNGHLKLTDHGREVARKVMVR
jgi:hypothetical protein